MRMKPHITIIISALVLLQVTGVTVPRPGAEECPPDVDQDGMVGVTDLLQVLGAWGPCPGPPRIVGIAAASNTLVRIWSVHPALCDDV